MARYFEQDIGILVDDEPLGQELHLCESGFEECTPTKPLENAQIDYWVLHYCVAGEGMFQIRETQSRVGPGTLFMIPPHTRNIYYPDPHNPWSYRWIGLRGTGVEQILGRCGLSTQEYLLHYQLDPQLEAHFIRCYEAMELGHPLKGLGEALTLLDYVEYHVGAGSVHQRSPGEIYLQGAYQFIQQNYHRELSVSHIAQAVGVDRTYLFKLFQRYEGVSPSQYLQRYRVEKACVLLRKSGRSVTHIAQAVGMNNSPYFTKLFVQYMGVTPTQYRRGKRMGDV